MTNKLEDFHVNKLTTVYIRRNPLEIALADNESFLVEKILKHRFTDSQNKIKSNLQFLIKWKGLNDPSWEPWKNTSKLILVHEYLNSKRELKKFLPKDSRD